MRLSTSMLYQKSMSSVTGAQANWQKVGQQLASGKRIVSPSDDPLAASQALIVKQSDARNNQLQATRDSVQTALLTEDTVLNDVVDVIHQIQQAIVQGGNNTLSDTDRQTLADSLKSSKEQLLNLANSTDGNNNYLFGGYKNDKPPFEMDPVTGNVTYVGGTQAPTQKVDENRDMLTNHTGLQAFLTGANVKEPNGTASESNIFASIDNAINALEVPLNNATQPVKDRVQEGLDKANRGMRNSLDNISTVRAELGTSLNEIDTLKNIGNSRSITLDDRVNQLEGVDWFDATSDYVMLQVTLQAAQKSFTDMQGMSLFQLNR